MELLTARGVVTMDQVLPDAFDSSDLDAAADTTGPAAPDQENPA